MNGPLSLDRCPMDGCRTRLLAQLRRPGRRPLSLYWCHWCAAGHAVVGEGATARDAGRFTLDDKTATVRFGEGIRCADLDADAVAALSQRLPARLKRRP
jgi:hypothetical protein